MLLKKTHENLVATNFGPQAEAYVASSVHSQGADLDRITARLQSQGDAQVLDLGCGGGHVSYRTAPEVGAVIAYDLCEPMLDAVAKVCMARGLTNVTCRHGRAEDLPFEDGTFDFVISRTSAHHWTDIRAALHEARRVLKAGGAAIFIDTVSPGQPLLDTYLQCVELLRDPSHVRDYSIDEWRALLIAAGFTPLEPIRERLRLEFASWIARIATPALQATAIRALQAQMAREVMAHFEIEPDGSFTIDKFYCEAH
ncbi:MAG: class I SAM-dependent methyltransferase [Alphaproteobacteria bacterium]|nr:class I SAM-dependent methyltransferase [Alphaproteobacteria bacterium]